MGQTLNILLVRNAAHWQYGGAEQFTFNLAECLSQSGVHVVVSTRVPELVSQCKKEGVPVFRNLWLRNKAKKLWVLFYCLLSPILIGQYAYLLWRHRIQVAVFCSRDDQIFGTLAARLLGRPTVWIDHSDMKHIVARDWGYLGRFYYGPFAWAKKIVTVSQFEKSKIAAYLPASLREKMITINNGALTPTGKPLQRPEDRLIVAFVGRLERDKGLFDLIEAMKIVSQKYSAIELWLAGKGPAEEELKRNVSRFGLDDQVVFLGHLNEVGQLLYAADFFVYPSHHDAAPLAPIEALLAGLPVIATRVGGIPEVINNSCGLLVPPHNSTELANAILKLAKESDLRSRLRVGALSQGKNFEIRGVVKRRYLPLFKTIAGS